MIDGDHPVVLVLSIFVSLDILDLKRQGSRLIVSSSHNIIVTLLKLSSIPESVRSKGRGVTQIRHQKAFVFQ